MKRFEKTWGLYSWHPEHGLELIHPDERQDDLHALSLRYFERVFFYSGSTEDGYIILQDGRNQYRVKPELYRVVPTPVFSYGAMVREKAEPERTGEIYYIGWHSKHKCEYYLLNINGRESKKRVFSDDLEYVDS